MALTPGTRLGVYEVTAPIGEGGMGQVYRATDSTLGRQVAIKILPDAFAADPDRLARFEREAKTLASLNHPHIAAIYAVEKSAGLHALVMELVEGDDLSQRIARGAIPIDETLPIAKQIAEALEAAHEQGIIHRDLKPANIKVRADGVVKVLDFGLAKAIGSDGGSSPTGMTNSPTITSPVGITGIGVLLGTAAYMAPEQAKGRAADKRSDVWAFGCVLYEMLTGARAFAGDDVSDTLAAVLRGEPDWRSLPTETPASIRRLLRRCLEKDRKRRLSDVADARLEIEDALTTPASDAPALPATGSREGWRRGALAAAAALVVGGAAAGGAVWIATSPGPGRVVRTAIQTSGATALVNAQRAAGSLAITPDGSRVVYTAAGQLVVRRLDQFEPDALTGLGSPTQPFISPNGQWVGFFDGMVLKKVAMTGGPPVTVFPDNSPSGGPLGAAWGPDGTIVYAGAFGAGLRRVADAGGEAETLTTPDRAQGEVRHLRPEFLPGGRALLFTIRYAAPRDADRIAVLNLETGVRTVLLTGTHARYLPSGHLVYGTEGTLRAVAFDLERRAVVGAPVPVLAPVAANQGQGAYEYDVADDGTLVYLTTRSASAPTRTPVWVDRKGRESPLGAEARPYVHPRLAPDGTRVAVLNAGNIWIWDLARARLTAGTLDGGTISIWTPDSRRLLFSSVRGGGVANLYVQAADGTGTATRLTDSPNVQHPTGITPDGAQVVFNEATPTQQGDIRLLTLTSAPQATPLVETRFDERGGVVSPDGRWLAYESNRSGAYEIYVQPFSAVDRGLWPVSTGGGAQPLWARSGRELFYVAPDGALMAVPWEVRGSAWSSGTPARLLEGQYFSGGEGTTVRQYDVTADGQRFLMMKEEARDTDAAPSIDVVQNWHEELKRLVPRN